LSDALSDRFKLSRAVPVSKPHSSSDPVIRDPGTTIDRATGNEPETPSAGMRHVFVGGVTTWIDSAP